MEEWRDIKGYEQLYQVSNVGRIKSLERIDCRGRLVKERILKQHKCIERGGTMSVVLSKYGKPKTLNVHRLVAEAFLNNPDGLPQVNHKDEDRTNNNAINLEWCDRKYNCNYGTRNERISNKHKKRICQYTIDGEFVAEYSSGMEIEKQLGYRQAAISSCCLNRPHHHTAYGYKWSYKL